MKKRIPIAILIGIIFSFSYPFLPRRRGNGTLGEQMEYHYAVIFSAIVYFIIYPIGYIIAKDRLDKKLKELKLKKYLIEKEPQNLKYK